MRNVRSMSFSVNSDVLDALTVYCKERGCSRSWFMSKALESYLKECFEDRADYEAAAAALEAFHKSGERTWSLDEVREEFGL